MNHDLDSSDSRGSGPSGRASELGIHRLGRVGDCFYFQGWQTHAMGVPPTRRYVFAGLEEPINPRFTITLGNQADATGHDGASPVRTDFLDLLWVKDVSVSNPLNVGVMANAADEKPSGVGVHEISKNDFDAFRDALEATKVGEIWIHPMVLHIARQQNTEQTLHFLMKAASQVGWNAGNFSLAVLLAETAGGDQVPLFLQVCNECMSCLNPARLPTALKENYINAAAEVEVSAENRKQALDVSTQLLRIDPRAACRYAQRVIATLKFDRNELADYLRPFFPSLSQWWIMHVIQNTGLGQEQVADALNVAGTAAATQNQWDLAMLAYHAALMIDPEAPGAAWNMGCLCLKDGDMRGAETFFKRLSRHYANQSLSCRWPRIQGQPWPTAPMTSIGFELPPAATAWPRISVVTPSYNQGQFIEETILSVLNQGYPNLQYIIVDGSSDDGTREVLERYRSRIDHLIIESDHGQSEAINKGLRLADGELITWLNSDDMQAPGALHRAALAWLENRADVIAGICLEHAEHQFRTINKPASDNEGFNPPQLARIFKYWLKGYYFLQPEVFFSRQILLKAGLLDETLYYSMDYDLWMRFSKAGAVLEVVDWPFAFFRKHESQKTDNLIESVNEQAVVRGRHYELRPDDERLSRIRRSLAALNRNANPSVCVLIHPAGETYSAVIRDELDLFHDEKFACRMSHDVNSPAVADADLVILVVEPADEREVIKSLRAAKPERLIVGWFWNNHRQLFDNYAIAELVDVTLIGHGTIGEYLKNDRSVHGGYLPRCVTRWQRQEVAAWFEEFGCGPRTSTLDVGFAADPLEHLRCLRELMQGFPDQPSPDLPLDNEGAAPPSAEKEIFAGCCSHQFSLVLPQQDNLLEAVFHSLLAGQIPWVAGESEELDLAIPKDLQDSLPIIRFSMQDPADFKKAYANAAGRIAMEGLEGPRRRHLHVLENHMVSSRIRRIMALARLLE